MFENIWCVKIVKANDHVQFYIKSNSESFQICNIAYASQTSNCVYKLIYFLQVDIFSNFPHFWSFINVFIWPGENLRFLKNRFLSISSSHQNHFKFATVIHCIIPINM